MNYNGSMMGDFGMGPGGEMISGKWLNRQTGQTIVVRDSFIDDTNKMFLNTSIGQISMDEFSKYYIQASDEEYDESGRVIGNKPISPSDIIEKDEPLKADPIFPQVVSTAQPIIQQKEENSITNFDLIDKIFKKTESRPKADLKIDWADFPEKELSMLVNYFDVKLDDIATYIGKHLINENLLKNALFDFLSGLKGFK